MMKMNLGARLLQWARGKSVANDTHAGTTPPRFKPPEVLGVPKDIKVAMDEGLSGTYNYVNQATEFGCIDTFPGYAALAQLTQIAEYRMLSEKRAEAMTRKWIKMRVNGDDDKGEKLDRIEARMTELGVRDMLTELIKLEGFFGRAQVFVDLGVQDGPDLAIPLAYDGAVVKGKLRKFKLVEPLYTYPMEYSASNPLADDYFNPRTWMVMGQRVHSSRLLTFVSRPVPDILKPAYNFGGLSMSQLARPYVVNWLKTRESVNRLISNYSTSGIKTDLSSVLSGDSGDDLLDRVALYTNMRDNQGTMLLDKEHEEFFQFSVPLGNLDKLQAQAQEHIASVASMPLPVLTGVTPAGLNASAEGDIRIWYDHVHDQQEAHMRPNLVRMIQLIQLSEFGVIDPDITFDFPSLWEQDDKELSEIRKADAEAAAMYIELGILTPEEVRTKLANDEQSGYTGLDLGIVIERPTEENDEDETSSGNEETDSP